MKVFYIEMRTDDGDWKRSNVPMTKRCAKQTIKKLTKGFGTDLVIEYRVVK
jgi:hypothetical protein